MVCRRHRRVDGDASGTRKTTSKNDNMQQLGANIFRIGFWCKLYCDCKVSRNANDNDDNLGMPVIHS